MSRHRWLIAGLIAGLVLLLLGGVVGYRLGTGSDPDWTEWQRRADSVEVELRQSDQDRAALRDSVEVSRETVLRLTRSSAAHQSAAQRWRAEADTLTAELALASTALDTIATQRAVITALSIAYDEQESRGDSLGAALLVSQASVRQLGIRVTRDSAEIATMRGILDQAPKPRREGLRILGVSVRPAAFAGMSVTGRPVVGAGVAVTR